MGPGTDGSGSARLYNSRILRVYLDYLGAHHPGVDAAELLTHVGLDSDRISDPAVWVTQPQVDRFHDWLLDHVDEPDIARRAGRWGASAQGLGPMRQLLLSLMDPASAYLLMGRLYPMFSRGATVRARRDGPGAVVISSIPAPEAEEKPYQCANRWGSFESVARVFTGSLAEVEHPECFHQGDSACVYRVRWSRTPEMGWRRQRNWLLLTSGVVAPPLLLLAAPAVAVPGLLALVAADLAAMWWHERRLRGHQRELLAARSSSGPELLEQLHARYAASQLIREVGQSISSVTDPHQLVEDVMQAMEPTIGFGRAAVLLASFDGSRLVFGGGYGFSNEETLGLLDVHWDIDGEAAPCLAVSAARAGAVRRAGDEPESTPCGGEADRRLGPVQVCCPLLCEGELLGVLAAGDFEGGHPEETAVGLLDGIASQLAVGLANGRAWVQLKESERRYRELVENARELEELSRTDELTALANRRGFERSLGDEVARARRHGTSLALVMADVDWFKSVNDRFGHRAGDRVLRELGALFGREARRYDSVARYGGEEFALLLPQTGLDGARLLAERLRLAVEQTGIRLDNRELRLTASFGVAILEAGDPVSCGELVEAADQALYRAKARGRNRVEIESVGPEEPEG